MTDATIEFGTFEAPEAVNPYTETVAQLIEAGENASVTLTLAPADVAKERLKFSKAANAEGKTARLRLTDDSKVKYGTDEDGEKVATGGTTRLTFTLTTKHKARRRKGADAAAEADQA